MPRLLACLFVLLFAHTAVAAERLNVVLVLVDDMGWTDLGCQGSDLYQTPHVDRLAKEGMRFTNGYSACTVCSPTRAAVMTGKYPARLHITDWIHGHNKPKAKLRPPEWTHFLPLEETTIAEALKAKGYATCHIGKWHLGEEKHWPDKQGFDHNIGGYHRGQPPRYFSPYKIPTLKEGPEGEYLTDREAEEACRFIAANADKPFFVYLPHYCVHTPLQGKADVIDEYKQRVAKGGESLRHRNPVFASMVESVDDAMGRIREQLEESGVADRTLIIFTSDNGGLVLGRRSGRPTNNAPLRAGKGSSYEGGVRVPFIAYWPGVTKPGTVCEEPVISCDLLPTILDATGIDRDEWPENVDGKSITPTLADPAVALDRDALFWHYPHYHPGGATPYAAIRARDWKLIEFYEDDRVELYHLSEDVGESKDLASVETKKAAELRDRLHAWQKSVGAQMPRPNPAYEGGN